MTSSSPFVVPEGWHVRRIGAPPIPVLFGLTFLLIYGPRLFGSFALDLLSLTSFLIIAAAILSSQQRMIWVPQSATPLVLLFSLSIYSLIVALGSPLPELFYPAKFVRAMANYAAAYILCGWYRERFGPAAIYKILEHIFWAAAIHSGVMVLQYFSEGASQVILSISGYDRAKSYRATGLTQSYNTLNIVQGTGFLIGVLLQDRLSRGRRQLPYYLGLTLTFVSLFLAGRTAAAVMLLFTGAAVLVRFRTQLLSRRALFMFGGAAAMLVLLVAVASEAIISKFFDRTLWPILVPLRTFMQTGSFEGTYAMRTFDVLFGRMYFLPESDWIFWVGSSLSGRGDTYIPSDVGYVLFIFGLGIVGTSAVVAFYLYLVWVALQWRKVDSAICWIMAATTIAALLVHAKEQVLLTRHAFTLSAMLLSAWYYLRQDARWHEEFLRANPPEIP